MEPNAALVLQPCGEAQLNTLPTTAASESDIMVYHTDLCGLGEFGTWNPTAPPLLYVAHCKLQLGVIKRPSYQHIGLTNA